MSRESRIRRLLLPLAVSTAVIGGLLVAPTAANAAGTATISGTVTDSVTTVGLVDAQVILYLPNLPLTEVASTVTSATGTYSLLGLDAGTYKMFVIPMGATYSNQYYPSGLTFNLAATFDLADGENLVADVGLDANGTISGTVVGANGQSDANLTVLLFKYDGGVYTGNTFGVTAAWNTPTFSWEVAVPPGDYRVNFTDDRVGPGSYRSEAYDNVFDLIDGTDVIVGPGGTEVVPMVTMTTLGPITNQRLSGADRYATAVAVSEEFESFEGAADSYVYVANGANYPDALSAGPAAALRGAPLLLSPTSALPANVAAEILRLDPERIIVVGGTGALSNSVFTALQGLIAVPENVVRLGGADRYATSRLLVAEAFGSSQYGFVATGSNFPDALAATAAAASLSAPVILVNGASSSVDSATRQLIGSLGLGITDLYVAGGTGVVSPAMFTSLGTIAGVAAVTRLGGADRYATSVLINEEIFHTLNPGDNAQVFLAVGTGFADALAGAAFAGSFDEGAPLFTVPSNCVPTDVLDLLVTVEAEKVWLLGGTGVLSNAVRDLTACS